jgi:DNA mismatch endonuclease (patch repair protein)
MGFRFRLYPHHLPGKPDMLLPRFRTVVFVHGCFWHRHPGCSRATTPATNQEYWLPKFERTVVRDQRIQAELRALGWNVIVVWECELKDIAMLRNKLLSAIAQGKPVRYAQDSPLTLAAEERVLYETASKKNRKPKPKRK